MKMEGLSLARIEALPFFSGKAGLTLYPEQIKAVMKNIARIETPAVDAAVRIRRVNQTTRFSSSNSAAA
jgi:hypothetical protein